MERGPKKKREKSNQLEKKGAEQTELMSVSWDVESVDGTALHW